MEESREQLEELMRRYGYNEDEAQAAYHLHKAWDLFIKLYAQEAEGRLADAARSGEEETERILAQVSHDTTFAYIHIEAHFHELQRLLAMRVLSRDYPDGWGGGSALEKAEG